MANIKKGQVALGKILKKLLNPGIKLENINNVPLYYMDETNTFIRDFNGTLEKGKFVNGQFKTLKELENGN